MRWADLFADLEGQWDAAAAADLADEVADRARREAARLGMADRLRAAGGRAIVATVAGAGPVQGTVLDSGPDWALLSAGPADALVPLAAILGITGLDPRAAADPAAAGPVEAGRTLVLALRLLARDRAPVMCTLVDSSWVTGTIARVGADHLELAEHGPGERPVAGAGYRLVPFAAIGVVRRR